MNEPKPMPGKPSKPSAAEPATIVADPPTRQPGSASVEAKPGTAFVNGRPIGWNDQTIKKPDQP